MCIRSMCNLSFTVNIFVSKASRVKLEKTERKTWTETKKRVSIYKRIHFNIDNHVQRKWMNCEWVNKSSSSIFVEQREKNEWINIKLLVNIVALTVMVSFNQGNRDRECVWERVRDAEIARQRMPFIHSFEDRESSDGSGGSR